MTLQVLTQYLLAGSWKKNCFKNERCVVLLIGLAHNGDVSINFYIVFDIVVEDEVD